MLHVWYITACHCMPMLHILHATACLLAFHVTACQCCTPLHDCMCCLSLHANAACVKCQCMQMLHVLNVIPCKCCMYSKSMLHHTMPWILVHGLIYCMLLYAYTTCIACHCMPMLHVLHITACLCCIYCMSLHANAACIA
jgi:hypothetical protein